MCLRPALALALALLPASGIARERQRQHGGGQAHGRARPGYADPSAVIAAELAFSRLAQDKGLFVAFRATAAPDAVMFTPQPVKLAEFLKSKGEIADPLAWQPNEAWSSCDGSYAATRGGWQRRGSAGYFITIWQRQPKGGYKWVLRQEATLTAPLPAREMIAATVADCDRPQRGPRHDGPPVAAAALAPALDRLNAASPDGTLAWTTQVGRAGAREFWLRLKKDGQMREVVHVSEAAPGAN